MIINIRSLKKVRRVLLFRTSRSGDNKLVMIQDSGSKESVTKDLLILSSSAAIKALLDVMQP